MTVGSSRGDKKNHIGLLSYRYRASYAIRETRAGIRVLGGWWWRKAAIRSSARPESNPDWDDIADGEDSADDVQAGAWG
jgi:hypothetical protein